MQRFAIALPPIAILAIALFMPESWQAAAEYDRAALIRGEWWRLWSGHWVHADVTHALGTACAWLGLAFLSRKPYRMLAALVLIITPLLSAATLLLPVVSPLPLPVLDHYRGGSGVSFVWMTFLLCNPRALAVQLAWRWRYALTAALTAKLAWDLQAWLDVVPTPGFQVAGEVHVLGALLGVLFASCVTLTDVPRSAPPPAAA